MGEYKGKEVMMWSTETELITLPPTRGGVRAPGYECVFEDGKDRQTGEVRYQVGRYFHASNLDEIALLPGWFAHTDVHGKTRITTTRTFQITGLRLRITVHGIQRKTVGLTSTTRKRMNVPRRNPRGKSPE